MVLGHFFLGIFIKLITGLDDTLTHIPVMASVTRTRFGRIAFSLGTLLAVCVAIVCSFFLVNILKTIPYTRYILAGMILALALAIYLDVFVHTPRKRAELLVKRSGRHFARVMLVGFIASVATVLDDIIAYTPLFLDSLPTRIFAIAGILVGTLLEIYLVIIFSKKISAFQYKEELAAAGLVILSILILFKII